MSATRGLPARLLRPLLGLPRLLLAALTGRETRWWRFELHRALRGRAPLLRNVCRSRKGHGRRALLCYITAPFLLDHDSPRMLKHANRWRAITIARLLDELGYLVDVVDYDNFEAPIEPVYDLLIGLGRCDRLAESWGSRVTRVYLGTGAEPDRANRTLRRRTREASRRAGCSLEVRRLNPFPASGLRHYDALACLGTEAATAEYAQHTDAPIYSWQNHAYDELIGLGPEKDFAAARKNFLFFGTSGQILCGLDLLLEVFSQRPELHLWVCGPFERERDFVDCYRKALFEAPNIHPVGWVEVGSPRFLELTTRCAAVVAPICAAHSHGSVVICMSRGLLPVAPREVAGIDTDLYGTTLGSLDPGEIARAVESLAARPPIELQQAARSLVATCEREFSQASFEGRFRTILQQITATRRGAGRASSD